MVQLQHKLTAAAAIMVVLIIMSLTLAGCTPARRPEPNDAVPAPDTDDGRSPSELQAQADQVRAAAEKVKGVERAYAVIVGNIVLIGINIRDTVGEQQSSRIKEQVASQIENDPRYVEAYITVDPELVARIRNVAESLARGKPITQFLDEVGGILQDLRPES